MARNIEIKTRIASVEALLPLAQALSDGPAQTLDQDDTFFKVPSGRLKLRILADGSAELIHYCRADAAQARASDYVRVPVPDPSALREALTRACGQQGRVRKRRWLFMADTTRIHLDRVEGLGDFMELEVVLQPGQTDDWGLARAESLLRAFGLAEARHEAMAYLDLLSTPQLTS
jgi:predicted adenylyl cyclase CyaB